MEYKIKAFTLNYLPQLTELLHTSFTIQNRDKYKYIQWKYYDKFHKNNTITYIAITENNKIISQYTNAPVETICNRKKFKCMLCMDMTTDPLHRGQGLISKLSTRVYNDVIRNNYDFSLGFSNDAGIIIDRNAKSYGYHAVGAFVTYFKFLFYSKKSEYTLIPTDIFNIETIPSTPNIFLTINKNFTYLTWRYVNKPFNDYKIFSVQKGTECIGYIVLRFIKRKCYVYDLILQNTYYEHIEDIFQSIENTILKYHARIVIYCVLENQWWKNIFKKNGYFAKRKNKINYYLTIKLHNKNIRKDFILNKENWLLMNGDIL